MVKSLLAGALLIGLGIALLARSGAADGTDATTTPPASVAPVAAFADRLDATCIATYGAATVGDTGEHTEHVWLIRAEGQERLAAALDAMSAPEELQPRFARWRENVRARAGLMRELARAAPEGDWRRYEALVQRAKDLKLDANKIAEPLGLTACAIDPLREILGGVPHRSGRPDSTGCRVGGYCGDVTGDSTQPPHGDWRIDRRGDISGAFVDVRDGQLAVIVSAAADDIVEPEHWVWTIAFASSRGDRRRIALTPLEGPQRESDAAAYWAARLPLDGEPAWLARRDVRWRLTAHIVRPVNDQARDGVPDRETFGR